MARLFKLGTAGKSTRTRRQAAGDWYCNVQFAPYRHRRVRLCSDKGVSETWAATAQAAVDRFVAGEPLTDEQKKELPRRIQESLGLVSKLAAKRRGSYAENVKDYADELDTAGRTADYVATVRRCLNAVGTFCSWRRLPDIDRDGLTAFTASRKADGLAPRSLNDDIAIVKGFTRWAVAALRLDADPCAHIKRVDAGGDRRRKRRALTPDEVRRLLAVAGPRRLLYLFALWTGLRKSELRRLEWRDVLIDDTDRPALVLRPEATKAKREDTIPLRYDLAALLREARPEGFAPTGRVFRTVPTFKTWKQDLKRANIEYRLEDGSIAGFHSLRVTYSTELDLAGVSDQTGIALTRHKDRRTRTESYMDIRLLDTFGAVERLPSYGDDRPEQGAAAALRTGTDDRPVGVDQIQDQKGRANVQIRSIPCSDTDSSDGDVSHGDLQETAVSVRSERVSENVRTGKRGDSNPRPLGPQPSALTN